MFVGGEVKHIAFAVGGAILFSGTKSYSIDFNLIPTLFLLVYASFIHGFFVGFFMLDAANQNFKMKLVWCSNSDEN